MKKPVAAKKCVEFAVEQPTNLVTDTALILSAAGVYEIDIVALDNLLHSGAKAQTIIDNAAAYSERGGIAFSQLLAIGVRS